MAIATGTFTGSGAAQTINTGLANISALNISELPDKGPGAQGYTNLAIQGVSQGMFINHDRKRLPGLALNGDGSFSASAEQLCTKGSTFAWEARCDD